ncbi:MAG: hypothetical protein ACJ741_16645 [Pyrinomonadaceae bacterium]
MGTTLERSPETTEALALLDSGDLPSSLPTDATRRPVESATGETVFDTTVIDTAAEVASVVTLGELPSGARLVLRCSKDWSAAAVSSLTPDCVVLTVASPTGHSYRVRRPADSLLTFDGSIPILSDRDCAGWRVALARYDVRW